MDATVELHFQVGFVGFLTKSALTHSQLMKDLVLTRHPCWSRTKYREFA